MNELVALGAPAVLSRPDWVAWNERTWRMSAEQITVGGASAGGARLEATLYRDRGGRWLQSPVAPYSALRFWVDQGWPLDKVEQAWLTLADELIDSIRQRHSGLDLVLPPALRDSRPFTWQGCTATVQYTYLIDLDARVTPHNSVLQKTRKAERLGYAAERSDDWSAISNCLQATARRAGFRQVLTEPRLRDLARTCGGDEVRGYVVKDARGVAVSGGIRLHRAGDCAIDWQQGTLSGALQDGANQLMYQFVLEDLAESRASSFDFAGANIRNVAEAKSRWRGSLVPFMVLSEDTALRFAKRRLSKAAASGDRGARVVRSISRRLARRGY